MTTHATIDLETLSTKPDAVVLTIGAIKFDPFTNDPPYSDFYYRFNVDKILIKQLLKVIKSFTK